MKNVIITGVVAATVLIVGCDKKDGSSGSSATSPTAQADAASPLPAAQPALTAWKQGDKAAAVSSFLAADWSARPLFASGSTLNLTEDQFKALSEADRHDMLTQLASLKQLAASVGQAGLDAVSKGDAAQARKNFTSVKQFGAALQSPNYTLLVQQVGKAFEKMSDTELEKIGR